jgi:hypothetical protein
MKAIEAGRPAWKKEFVIPWRMNTTFWVEGY